MHNKMADKATMIVISGELRPLVGSSTPLKPIKADFLEGLIYNYLSCYIVDIYDIDRDIRRILQSHHDFMLMMLQY